MQLFGEREVSVCFVCTIKTLLTCHNAKPNVIIMSENQLSSHL